MVSDHRVKKCSCGNVMKITVELPGQGAYMTTEGCSVWIARWHHHFKDFTLLRHPTMRDEGTLCYRWEYLWCKYVDRLPKIVTCNACHTQRRTGLFERMIAA